MEDKRPRKRQKIEQPNDDQPSGTLAQRTRPTKPDFKPLYDAHRKIMAANGCDNEKMVKLRHVLHENAEGDFKEVNTQKRIRDLLLEFGIGKSDIKDCAGTGLVVHIRGTGPVAKEQKGSQKSLQNVALRADMDGLPMEENNFNLKYRTKTDHAHMCGHDGHMATIMSVAQVLQKNRDKIPKDKFVRLLFQPAEEVGPGGAPVMVEEGCLDGIEEIYGYHNVPNFDEGDIRVCEGPILAAQTDVNITIKGQGGHGSAPHKLRDPISAAAMVHAALGSIMSRNIDSRRNIVFTICQLRSGSTFNVYPDCAYMKGSIRSYDTESLEKVKEKIRSISKSVAEGLDCEAEVEIIDTYPAVLNHPEPTAHVLRLAEKYIGKEHMSQDDLPLSASENFSYFLQKVPGCFFLLGTMKEGEILKTLHNSNYDYNDDLIPTGAYFFIRIVEDRLDVKILK